jgi:hypothetical protein
VFTHIEGRVSLRQKRRLARAMEFVQNQSGALVSLDLLFVDSDEQVLFFPDFLS